MKLNISEEWLLRMAEKENNQCVSVGGFFSENVNERKGLKVNKNLTEVVLLVDRSGSMEEKKEDTEGGVAAFIRTQQETPGECNLTLIQFDDKYETVYTAKPVRGIVSPFVLNPRGSTSLLDAVGRSVVETGFRFKNMAEAQRPGLVVFVILTDGLENTSKEYTRAKIKQMIQHQTDVYKWQFQYLGANQDAFTEAKDMGMNVSLDYDDQKMRATLHLAGMKTRQMREQYATGAVVDCVYTDEEKNSVK